MTYEYVCTACGHAWEAEQSISEQPLKTCPNCHEQTARRQISGGAGFILKGGGWYADLYGSSPKKSGGDEGKSNAKTEGGSKDSGSKDSGSKDGSGGPKKDGTSSGSSGSSSSSSGTPTSGSPSGSKATGAASGA